MGNWEKLNRYKWSNWEFDTDFLSDILLTELTKKEIKTLLKFIKKKREKLEKEMDDYFEDTYEKKAIEYLEISPDTLWDLSAFIVGSELIDFICENNLYKQNYEYAFNEKKNKKLKNKKKI